MRGRSCKGRAKSEASISVHLGHLRPCGWIIGNAILGQMKDWNPNDIVKWSNDQWNRCWSVVYQWTDGHARPTGTTIIEHGNQRVEVKDSDIRVLTFREFIWFEHPVTLHMMSGKTRGYIAIIIHVMTFLLTGAAEAQGFSWWGLLCLLPVAGYWWGTWNNYTGKWV